MGRAVSQLDAPFFWAKAMDLWREAKRVGWSRWQILFPASVGDCGFRLWPYAALPMLQERLLESFQRSESLRGL